MRFTTAFPVTVMALAVVLLGSATMAQDTSKDMPGMAGHDMSGHDMTTTGGATTKATEGYMAAMEAMMDTTPPYTGDADIDFANGMIAHHQAAIDMAKVELEYGKDPALRKLAQEIIKAQASEIALMKDWLAKQR